MSQSNMFDIKTLPAPLKAAPRPPPLRPTIPIMIKKTPQAAPMKPVAKHVTTPRPQIHSLKDFDEVPRDQWTKIPARKFIRYIRADTGALVRGGFVAGYVMIANQPAISLMSNITGRKDDGCVVWTIAFADIKSIYTKRTA